MNELYNLKGKTAWITGGKRVGQEVAYLLAQNGANIVLTYNKSKKEAELAQNKIRKFGVKILLLKTDVTSRQEVKNAVSRIKKEFGKIDVLVLMASIFERINIESIKEEDLQRNFDVHVKGTFWQVIESLSIMPKGSHVVTISDQTSIGKVYKDFLPYVTAKGAVAALTRALAAELSERGIFVNSIAPGPVLRSEGLSDVRWKQIRNESTIKYPITDEECVKEFAKLALYLSTVRSTGFIYPLDFGHL